MQPQDPRGGYGPAFRAGLGLGRGGGRNRVRRGDVQAAVLALLIDGDMHGYQIITELAERSGGAWRPSPGSVYPTLGRLERNGLIVSQENDGKRTYKLTPAGRRAAQESGGEPWSDFTEQPGATDLRSAAQSLFAALSQLESVGSDHQLGRAAEIVRGARKSIYLMLAEEES